MARKVSVAVRGVAASPERLVDVPPPAMTGDRRARGRRAGGGPSAVARRTGAVWVPVAPPVCARAPAGAAWTPQMSEK
ncbi:hypothetical protein FRACA_140042 [Frankia canadensis]|uniref:Uncharacterized protein n=1 Tax=Frankia canadensis TaxID=1836972 RepID=A0A2I2KLB0_9ACTN|nr:hypothetical protein FRACA_140042 [Frankia canadensis]SOU53733.1 hypothetical protein FRACA_140042 [Frankia canadensis]